MLWQAGLSGHTGSAAWHKKPGGEGQAGEVGGGRRGGECGWKESEFECKCVIQWVGRWGYKMIVTIVHFLTSDHSGLETDSCTSQVDPNCCMLGFPSNPVA